MRGRGEERRAEEERRGEWAKDERFPASLLSASRRPFPFAHSPLLLIPLLIYYLTHASYA